MKSNLNVFLRKYLPGFLFLTLSVVVTVFVVQRFRLPGQSNMIESMAMDMATMKPEIGSVPVGTAEVVLKSLTSEQTYNGTVRGLNEITIAARIEGVLSLVSVYAGVRVKKGQLLAQLNAPELAAETRVARSQVQESEAEKTLIAQEAVRLKAEQNAAASRMNEARAALKTADANLKYWRERLPREKSLLETEGIPREEFERYQADTQAAEASVASAQATLRTLTYEHKAKGDLLRENGLRLRMQQAGIQTAAARVQERKVLENFTRIMAPLNGVITERLQAPGALVTAGTPILTLAEIGSVRIQVNVPDADVARFKVGDRLRFTTSAQPDDEIETTISSIAPAAVSSSRTQILEAIVENPEGLFMPGQYVKASLQKAEETDARPVIPERALLQVGGQDSVWVVRNQRAHWVPVTVGIVSGEWVTISDLEKGTQVITDGYEGLVEGMAVSPVTWTAEGPSQLPVAGGANRLHEGNQWSLTTPISPDFSLTVSISPQPPIAGENSLRFELIQQKEGKKIAFSEAKISLKTSMPSMSMAGPNLVAKAEGKGVYTAAFSGMSGLWQVVATLEIEGKRLKPFTFELNIP